MYESMIKAIQQQARVHMEDEVMSAVQRVGISVDKEELIRALKYDRGQYEKGYADGKRDGGKRNAALELLLDWAIECDFGYDNIPEEYEEYKEEVADMGYKEGLIYIAEKKIEEWDRSGCDNDSCPIVFD